MDPTHTEFWDGEAHREFVEHLDLDRLDALRDLLLVAAMRDELLTAEERVEIAYAFHDIPGLDETVLFDTANAVDHADEIYARYHEGRDGFLEELLARLGDTLDLSHALEAVVVIMSTNGTPAQEAMFARRLGVLMDVPDHFVDDLLQRFGWQL